MIQPPPRVPPVSHHQRQSVLPSPTFDGRQRPVHPTSVVAIAKQPSDSVEGSSSGKHNRQFATAVVEEPPAGRGIDRQATTVERQGITEEKGVPIPGRSHNNFPKSQQGVPSRDSRGVFEGSVFEQSYKDRYGQPSPVAFGEEAEGIRRLNIPFRPHPVGGLKSSLTIQPSYTVPTTHTVVRQASQTEPWKPARTTRDSSSCSEENCSNSASQTQTQNSSTKAASLAEDQEETLTYSDEAMSSSSPTPESWISSFCSLLGHEYFAEVSEDFIEDDFNLTGLQSQVPMYKEALEMVLDVEPEDDDDEEEEEDDDDDDEEGDKPPGYRRAGDRRHMRVASDLSVIESSAELLYGLIHQRYITSRPGIQQMAEKYELSHFGTCPRVFCNGCKVLPVGYSDTPGLDTVKLFCPSCLDIYTPPNSRFQSVDGAFFGTTFGCLFFMTFPELEVGVKMDSTMNGITGEYFITTDDCFPQESSSEDEEMAYSPDHNDAASATTGTSESTLANQPTTINGVNPANLAPGLGPGRIYEPRIYGFRVSDRARSGPRMQWLRMKPTGVNELDESKKYHETHDATMDEEQSPSVPVPRRKKAPVRRRRPAVGAIGGGSPMDTNGGGGEVG